MQFLSRKKLRRDVLHSRAGEGDKFEFSLYHIEFSEVYMEFIRVRHIEISFFGGVSMRELNRALSTEVYRTLDVREHFVLLPQSLEIRKLLFAFSFVKENA